MGLFASALLVMVAAGPAAGEHATDGDVAAASGVAATPEAPAAPKPVGVAPASSLAAIAVRDLTTWAQLASGSPVALRARAVTAPPRPLSRTAARELEVFKNTQQGPFDVAIAAAAETFRLDPFLLKGLLENESRLKADLVGKRIYKKVGGVRRLVGGGARGIAQFTGDGVDAVNEIRYRHHLRGVRVVPFTDSAVMDPALAIPASAELLASYIDRFGRDGGVTAYNSGPHGGRLVARHGFYAARRSGQLSKLGQTQLQGHRFLLNVLRRTNRLRKAAGLAPLAGPGDDRSPVERHIDRVLHERPSARRKLPTS